MLTTEFGYLPIQLDEQVNGITVRSFPDLAESVSSVENNPHAVNEWVYLPRPYGDPNSDGKHSQSAYERRVFGLPKTHRLTHNGASSLEHLKFIVWCMGFFHGLRLTTNNAGFLDATPIKTSKLTDFILRQSASAIVISDRFWKDHSGNLIRSKQLQAAINTLFFSRGRNLLPYETFMYNYTALDSCYALLSGIRQPLVRVSHARRIQWLCDQLGLDVPDWALPDANGETLVSKIRNQTFHEALFVDEPLGFTAWTGTSTPPHHRNILLEMQNLCSRLIVALLGRPDCKYVKSALGTRNRFLLDL